MRQIPSLLPYMSLNDYLPHTRIKAGIAYMLCGAMSLALSDSLAKWLGAFYSPMQLLFLRTALALPVLVLLVVATLGPTALKTRNLPVHLMRGAINVVAAVCFYMGLTRLPLAYATAIAFCAPLFITAISVVLLKERVSFGGWAAVLLGFVGVLFVVQPIGETIQWAALLPVGTAFFYALMMVSARWIRQGEHMLTTMLYIVLCQLVFTVVPLAWSWQPLQWQHVWHLAGLALFSTMGLGLITQAFRIAPASTVAPFDYSTLIWATLLGLWVWHEQPNLGFYLGTSLIVLAGLYTAWSGKARPAPGL
nr:DMT family transporter [Lampropedia aestuarii]